MSESTVVPRRLLGRYQIGTFQTAVVAGIMLCLHALILPGAAGVEIPETTTRHTSPTFGVWAVGILVVETFAIVFVWRRREWIPDWIRSAVVRGVKLVVWGTLLAVAAVVLAKGDGLVLASSAAVWLSVVAACYYFDIGLWLVVHNLAAFGFAVFASMIAGTLFGPGAIVVVLVLSLVWDHVAVNLSDIMGDLVDASAAAKIPNYFALPRAGGIDLADVRKVTRGIGDGVEPPAALGLVIGVGDFVIPTAFLVSLAIEVGGLWHPLVVLPALGVYAAIPALAGADGATPALPYLNTGALLGAAAAIALAPASVGVLFG